MAGQHMPHWMTHGRPMFAWYCCGWTQLMYGYPDQCEECGRFDCPEAQAYRRDPTNRLDLPT